MRALSRPALAVALIALAGCATGPAVFPPSAASPLADKPMPDFARPTIAGPKVDTASMRGKVVVVKFFAKYCEPCKRTLPAAQALATEHPDVSVVGVAEDESESDVREVIGTYGLTFPVVHDRANVLSGRYRVNELPITFVIDTKGVVRWVGGPAQTEPELASAVAAARP